MSSSTSETRSRSWSLIPASARDSAPGQALSPVILPPLVRLHPGRHGIAKKPPGRPPRRVQELFLRLPTANNTLAQRLGRSPTVTELVVELDSNEEEILEAMQAYDAYAPCSLDAPTGDADARATPGDSLGSVDSALTAVEDWETVRASIAQLPERERRIVVLRFFGNLSQAEIGDSIGISQVHVSRLLRSALTRLRHDISPTGVTAGSA